MAGPFTQEPDYLFSDCLSGVQFLTAVQRDRKEGDRVRYLLNKTSSRRHDTVDCEELWTRFTEHVERREEAIRRCIAAVNRAVEELEQQTDAEKAAERADMIGDYNHMRVKFSRELNAEKVAFESNRQLFNSKCDPRHFVAKLASRD